MKPAVCWRNIFTDKMALSCTSVTVIALFTASIVVQISGELILLRDHLTKDGKDGDKRELTCVSEDDGAALIWNFNADINEPVENDPKQFTNFQPKKPTANDTSKCGIRNSTSCVAEWGNKENWDRVKSAKLPMGPVFDYRWEGFEEILFDDYEAADKYRDMGKVGKSGTAVFSVRALQEVHVLLCNGKNPKKGPCFWIMLEGARGKGSGIFTCPVGAPETPRAKNTESCNRVTSIKHEPQDVVHPYEWRTFTLVWIDRNKTIQVFKNTDREKKLLLKGSPQEWHDVLHMSIGGEISTRFRFHFYEYYSSEVRYSELYTREFVQPNNHFCVEMLVGLCPHCGLNVNLVKKKDSQIDIGHVSGNESSTPDDLLAWQLVRLSQNVEPRNWKLKITTDLHNSRTEGRWAIGSLQTCRSIGGLRKSTITISQEKSTVKNWMKVRCQKLSYSTSAVVDAIDTKAIGQDTSQLQQLIRNWTTSCGSSCPNFDQTSSICNSAGCTCARGLGGKNCDEKCLPGFYGYNCDKNCGSCHNGPCNATTGFCREGCNDSKLLPPLCQRTLGAPTISDITDTTARVVQEVQLEAGVHLELRLKILDQMAIPYEKNSEGSSIYEARITDLEPNRTYTVQSVAWVTFQANSTLYLESLSSSFTTTGKTLPPVVTPDNLDVGISSVSEREVTLSWKAAPSINGVIPRYHVSIKLMKLLGCEDLEKSTPSENERRTIVEVATVHFDGLHPYAIYTASVTAETTGLGMPGTKIFQTPAVRIPTLKVDNLKFDAKQGMLSWTKPGDCTKFTGPANTTRLEFGGVSDSVRNWKERKETNLTFTHLVVGGLASYTKYRVRAYVVGGRDKTINPSLYKELIWTTPPAAPPAVTELEIYEADPETNTCSLRWMPPQPANGEIESYRVIVAQGDQVDNQQTAVTIKASKIARSCGKPGNYVCYRNINLPSNVGSNKTTISVLAKNKDVEGSGPFKSVQFLPEVYFRVPSRPHITAAIPEAHGIVTLTWEPSSKSNTKISKFYIRVDLLETKLQENTEAQFPKVEEHPALPEQKPYTTKLYLPTSSSYSISVLAMDTKNMNSSEDRRNISLVDSVAFQRGSKLNVTQNGTSITVTIPGVVNATDNTLITVTVEGGLTCRQKNQQKSLSQSSQSKWVAAEYKPNKTSSKILKLDPDENSNMTSNCSLNLEESYDIIVEIKNSNSQLRSQILMVSSNRERLNKKRSLAWLIIFPLLAVCLLLILFIWHRKRNRAVVRVSYADVLRKTSLENLTNTCNRQSSTPPPNNFVGDRMSHVYAVPFVSDSNSVSLKCFEDYTKESLANGQLRSQYSTFPRGLTRPCEYGRLPQNMPKNRNKNLVAYDHTRVVLDKIPGDPYSDYINANYVKGYGDDYAYIATQGPKPNTINDFWRMIWQKEVRVICMLTNLVENGKTMCEQYWPEVGAEVKYGDVTILNADRHVFADYTFRTFRVSNDQETRKVTHVHYTGWPDHGVPMYSQSLVTFLKKLVEILEGHGPVVIHCSEGDGRTGTIILCDMCVRQGIMEREIEVPAITKRMYESRANMLDSPQQYLLAHIIITESIMSIPTQVPCTDILQTRIKTLRKQLPTHIQRLNNTVWQERALHSLAGSQPNTSGRVGSNTLPELIPITYEVVQNSLYSGFDSECNYISAVSVDGVRIKEQYMASQLPLPSGLPDFWRFVAERNIELILILQRLDPDDPMYCDIMPGESILVPVPYIQLETKSSTNEEGLYAIDKLVLTDTSEEKARQQYVTVLTCHGWGCGEEGKPPPPSALVSLWRASENIPRKEGLTLVICQDGVTACGLYLALSFLLERMAVERECDVISAVRAVRRSRPEFVQSLPQFDYLYEAAVNYADSFETYANFS